MKRHASAGKPSKGIRLHGVGDLDGSLPLGRGRALALGLVALVAAFAFSVSISAFPASAAITHNPEPFSPIDGSGSNLTLGELPAIAIDEETGNVFVFDGGAGHERIAILGGEGGAPVGLAAPYEIPGFEVLRNSGSIGLAFDNSATSPARGTLYAEDKTTGAIKKYRRNSSTKRYEQVGEITIPLLDREVPVAVDGAGNLYVVNRQKLYEFSASGMQLAEYTLSTRETASTKGIALDALGDLFVATNGELLKFPVNGSGRLESDNPQTLASVFSQGVAYEPSTNHIVALVGGLPSEFDAESGERLATFGRDVVGYGHGIAVDSSSGRIYVSEGEAGLQGHENVDVFGPAVIVPTLTIGAASGITGTTATLNGTVDPEGLPVLECFFEWREDGAAQWQEQPCEPPPPTDSETHQVAGQIEGLTPNGTLYEFRLVARNENGIEETTESSFRTIDTVTTQDATGVGQAAATLNGVVRPEGKQFLDCVFEYGLTSAAGFESQLPCDPQAGSIGPDFEAHSVSAALIGLAANETYKFRLTATNRDGTLSGQTLTFSTLGPPLIAEVRAGGADQTSVTLEAAVDPRGSSTVYRFEWGPTQAYGHRVPAEFDLFAGSGLEPLQVSAKVAGLEPGTAYHYRVVATSGAGTTAGADQLFETLNGCGLPEGRCFELVSPRDVGPIDLPGQQAGGHELIFQTAKRSGALAYVSESGLPTATKGAEVLSRGIRGPAGWSSSQLSPPLTHISEGEFGSAKASEYFSLNQELSCGVVASNQPLTSEPAVERFLEEGGQALYRQNSDGTYTAITRQAATNVSEVSGQGSLYNVQSLSEDCTRIVFATRYRFPGVSVPPRTSSTDSAALYEWDDGTLRAVSYAPDPGGGETPVAADFDAASADGSRVFFTQTTEAFVKPIFVRENGTRTRAVSVSQTSIADPLPNFEYATEDGRRAFFIAPAGLTDESHTEGKDLYEYDLDADALTDLSLTAEAGGAEVTSFIGASEDGTHVYFAAQGQLVPGRGKTLTDNQAAGTDSIYSAQGGKLTFVASVKSETSIQDPFRPRLGAGPGQTSRVSADGRYLLFESITGTNQKDETLLQAYLYDADATSDATVCISCRHDGKANVPISRLLLASIFGSSGSLHAPRTLVEKGGQAIVFFASPNALAPGATEGGINLYEWAHGQVFLVTSEPPNRQPPGEIRGNAAVAFAGANEDGTDIYLVAIRNLTWEDGDERTSMYDARVAGGFPQPPPGAAPCDPAVEGACQGTPPQPGTVPAAATPTFTGPGNVKHPRKKHRKKHRKRKHHAKGHHHRKHVKRSANRNRRAAK